MRIYSNEVEENIHAQQQARAWVRSGFLTIEQKAVLDKLLPTDVRQTNFFLRVVLAAFTLLLLASAIGLLYWVLRPLDSMSLAFLFAVCAVPAYIAAELFAKAARLYRYGIEEGFGIGAAVLVCVAAAVALGQMPLNGANEIIANAATVSLVSFWLYTRFGWMYAAFGSTIALSVIPFQFHLSDPVARLVLAAVLGTLFFFTYAFSMHTRPDFQRSRNQILQASLLLGIYLACNLQLESLPLFARGWRLSYGPVTHAAHPTIYWITYALCWTQALALIAWGLLRRRRVLLDVGLLTLGLSIATNKDYWGLPHKSWDPILFGAVCIAIAAIAHRLLLNQQRAARWQLTGDNILTPEHHGLDAAALGVMITAPVAPTGTSTTSPFGHGSTGGGGASRHF